MNAILSVQHGALAGRSFRLGRRVRVGSSAGCEVRLPDSGVAPYHFLLEASGDHYILRDMESGQGTFVDGSQVIAESIRPGTTIYAGEAVLFFQDSDNAGFDEIELIDAGRGENLENEVRRIYESTVTYLTEPEPEDPHIAAARTALSALFQVGRLSGSESDLQSLVTGIAGILLEALGADRCLVLFHEGSGRFKRAAEATAHGRALPTGQPVADVLRRAAGEGSSILIRDALRDRRFDGSGVTSVMCAPLKASRKILGVVYCDMGEDGERFQESDLKLATAVARQAGGAVERRILEGQLHEQAQRLETRVRERTAELEKAMEELRTAQERLVASERLAAVGMLVQGIAHNMATPLSGILGFAQVLKARHPDMETLDEIIALCRHLDGILENLLLKGRRESRTDPVPIDLNALVEEAMTFFMSDMFFKHEVDRRLELAGDLPPLWGVWSDFSQSLQNLIRNALDAMTGRPKPSLTVRTATDHGEIVLDVEDTGGGISAENCSRVFEPFFTTKGAGGTGLGLFTTRNLLAPYGGRIACTAVPGGTRFTIRLPAAESEGRSHASRT